MNNKLGFFKGSFCELRSPDLNKKMNYATGKGIKIGVIDSGWDRTLIDNRIKEGIGLVNPKDELMLEISSDYNDLNGHGTSCTDLILRIAPDAVIYPIKVFGIEIETSANILISAIKWALDNDLKILNISLGTLLPEALEPLYKACEIARRKGIILIAAKSNSNEWSYPAIFENVIGVEMKNFDNIFKFEFHTNEGTECKAKGVHDNICGLKGIRMKLHGNSFAAPIITGITSLIIENNLGYDIDDVRNELERISLFYS